MMECLFWFCLIGLAYIYFGYPVLIWCLARLFPKPVKKAPFEGTFSVIIVAHNEAVNLPRKLRSILAAEDVAHMAEIIVASDGSTDGTGRVIGEFVDSLIRGGGKGREGNPPNQRIIESTRPPIRLLEYTTRRGKAAVLNDVVPPCQSDIVVLTDARQEIHPRALAELLAGFADEKVGAVSGELVFSGKEDASVAARGIDFYWRYEKFIRRHEGRFRSVPGATGALYGIRRELFEPISTQALLDDVLIPMQIVVRGFRCVFEPEALVFDEPSPSPEAEAVRKRRTIAGNAQMVTLRPEWLLPWRNPLWFEFVSHKLLRLLSPLLLLLLLAGNVLLLGRPGYSALLAGQLAFYAAAAGGWVLDRMGVRMRWVGVPMMFVALNVTTLLAWGDALRGRYRSVWSRPC